MLDGLSLQRAMPAVDSLTQVESEVLLAAADVALAPAHRGA
ncbi:hypothetical protein [Brachybacterium halotolerans]|nr:hypothetical protein [Brachybacterium halotolerans]